MKKFLAIGILEILLVLSVIAVLIIAITNYYFVTQRNHLILSSVNQIMRLNIGIQDWKGKQKDYTGLSVEALADIGAFNKTEYSSTDKKLYSPFNTPVSIMPMLANQHYSIIINALPDWACKNLVSKFKPDSNDNNYKVDCIMNSFIYLGK